MFLLTVCGRPEVVCKMAIIDKDYSRQCECVFVRTIRANYSRELFARIIRVSVKRP